MSSSYELKTRITQSLDEVKQGPLSQDRDEVDLARVGKKAVLKRNFSVLSILGFSCTIIATWEGILDTFLIPMENGGPATAIYGYLFAWAGTACCFLLLAELSSMAPTSGGQYHWCAMLAPPRCMKFFSYITGWLTVIGWQAAFASTAFLCGTEIQGAAILAHDNYDAQPYQGTLIMWAAVVIALGVNLIGGKFLPRLENLILVLHILGFLAFIIPLTYMAEHKTAREVFTTWTNEGGWSSNVVVFFLGMQGGIFAFSGGDAAVHMAEEVQNAAVTIPRAIMMTVVINGCLGLAMLLAMLFCMGDLSAALETPTGYPFMHIFYQATQSLPGSMAMISALLVIGICATIGMLAATSRQFWSFARDRGIPGWRIWSRVSPSSSIPIYSVIFTMSVSCLLGLINIGSDVALNDILSLAISGLYLSYLSVAVLLLYRRINGDIHDTAEHDGMIVNTPGSPLVWGPFHMSRVVGIVVNTFAVIYMIIVIFFSFWPTEAVVDYKTMNYSVVGTMGTVFIALVYYLLRAKDIYQGPVVETY